jgi:hypothetical protein
MYLSRRRARAGMNTCGAGCPVTGYATPARTAGHAGATANLKLTFHLDHSAGGADQARLQKTVDQLQAAQKAVGDKKPEAK